MGELSTVRLENGLSRESHIPGSYMHDLLNWSMEMETKSQGQSEYEKLTREVNVRWGSNRLLASK